MISLDKLSEMGVLSWKNGLRLHFDSALLLNNKAYASSVLLSVLSMEEFGKYFSISSYVFYTGINGTRDVELEQEYFKQLYIHPYKQKQIFARDGFEVNQKNYHEAQNRYFEELKQRSLYVGFERDKGVLNYNKGLNDPAKITAETARVQVKFLNHLIIKMTQEHIKGIIELDEPEINDLLNSEFEQKLQSLIE